MFTAKDYREDINRLQSTIGEMLKKIGQLEEEKAQLDKKAREWRAKAYAAAGLFPQEGDDEKPLFEVEEEE